MHVLVASQPKGWRLLWLPNMPAAASAAAVASGFGANARTPCSPLHVVAWP